MFHSAALKLTVLYLSIIMALSIGFSMVVYRLSATEISQGLLRHRPVMMVRGQEQEFDDFRLDIIGASNAHLRDRLILFNLFALVTGGVMSYLFARKSLEPIEAAMAAQKRFTADASHELRTPLTAMQTEIEVALRTPKLDAKASRAVLESNLEEVQKLKALSTNLLSLARNGDTELKVEELKLSDIVGEAIKRVEPLAKDKNIKLTKVADDATLPGDKAALVDTLVVLLDNAIKYSETGHPVKIVATLKGDSVKIEVTDKGRGIADADLDNIFDRFYRSDTSRTKGQTKKAEGFGLGLAIAKQTVERHSGQITVKSKLGSGTTFTIMLPKRS